MSKTKTFWQEMFDNCSPTWMENWYEDLHRLTIPSSYFRLTESETQELMKFFDGKGNQNKLKTFKRKLHRAFQKIQYHREHSYPKRVFVRLGSRSPKDNPTEIHTTDDVFLAFNDSARILEDFILCEHVKYNPFVFVREWVDIKKEHEFRCFVKDGELKGISQYFYNDRFYYLDDEANRKLVEWQARMMLTEIKKNFKLESFIFDIVYKPTPEFSEPTLPLLIEINPYSSWTDPCLFDWAQDKFNKFQFKWFIE